MKLSTNQIILLLDTARGFNRMRHGTPSTDDDLILLEGLELIERSCKAFPYIMTSKGMAYVAHLLKPVKMVQTWSAE